MVLVAVEIWTDRDRIPLSVKPLEMLKDFSKYRQQNININADAVHLFTWVAWFASNRQDAVQLLEFQGKIKIVIFSLFDVDSVFMLCDFVEY